MRRFDCLSPEFSLQGPHLLEASAGTGKTFAVEQIFVRLILESSLQVEQMLVITFTRAATRELKERIRSNIEKALVQLASGSIEWPYLEMFRGKKAALQTLRDALALFDRSQIFTIHGFCHRMLKEFAFEAKFCASQTLSDEPRMQTPKKIQEGVIDFLSSLSTDLLCVEQLDIILKKVQSVERLAGALVRQSMKELQPGRTFSLLYEEYIGLLKNWDLSVEQALEDFRLISSHHKATLKGRFEEQIKALLEPPTPESFAFLISEKGSLFNFLSPTNRKVKYAPPPIVSEPFFAWGATHLLPILEKAADPKRLFSTLAYEWTLCAKKLMSKEDLFDPDTILQTMHKHLESPSFLKLVQNKYAAAVIDEFQDTDKLQWDIFRELFLKPGHLAKSVFLVGDPKQSIYRFRKADVYTYLEAKEYVDPSRRYFLDTNFRSSPRLLQALNVLFQREWLSLPKLSSFLPYQPVSAGRSEMKSLEDQKGALHFFVSDGPSSSRKSSFEALVESVFLPFIAREIASLRGQIKSLSDCAILVKDRYQAAQAVRYLQERGLPAITKNHLPLGETFAFEALFELLHALIDPKDRSKAKLVLAGPLARARAEEMPTETPLIFFELKAELEEKGLAPFFQTLFSTRLHQEPVLEALAREDADFYRDFFHAIELLLQWERAEGFSLEGLSRTLHKIRTIETEEDERVRRRLSSDDEAVQVMTMHVSKGLEFDVVFALGLASQTPKPDEELEEFEAEKLRQLYVAMTRAKRRLYVPICHDEESLDGTASPIALFLHKVKQGQPLQMMLQEMGRQASITWEVLQPGFIEPSLQQASCFSLPTFPSYRYQVDVSCLHSFTSLARSFCSALAAPLSQEELSVHTLPRGAEMGVLLHELLEDIFSAPYALWRDEKQQINLIENKLKDSKFSLWKPVIQDLLGQVVSLPFLAELEPQDVRTEVEFMFERPPHYIKGFIDLLFRRGNQLYFLDWKSNWLGENDEAYDYAALEKNMKEHDYELQAALYAEALRKSFPHVQFGGAYYLFLRGVSSITQGIFFIEPRRDLDVLA